MSFRIQIKKYDMDTSPYSEIIHTWLYGYYQIFWMSEDALIGDYDKRNLFRDHQIELIGEYLRGTFKEIILQTVLDSSVNLNYLKVYKIGSQEDEDYFKMWSQHEHTIG